MASSVGLYPFWRPLNKYDDDNDDDEAYNIRYDGRTGEQREKAAVLHVSRGIVPPRAVLRAVVLYDRDIFSFPFPCTSLNGLKTVHDRPKQSDEQ